MGRKGRKSKGSASIKVKPSDLETLLLSMKKSRGDAAKQAKHCETLLKFAAASPVLFRDSTISTEVSLCVLLALKADPDDADLQITGCGTICALLLTPGCTNSIFRLGGIQALMTIMDQEIAISKNLGTIFRTMGYLCSKNRSHYGPPLVAAGFIQYALKALKMHPDDLPIQLHGIEFLRDAICTCVHDQQILKESIDLVVHTLNRFGGNLTTRNSLHHGWEPDHCNKILEQSCRVLVMLMDDYPETTSTIKNAGTPSAVLFMMKHHPDYAKLQSMGVWFLRRFAKNDDVLCSECFPTVVSALKLHCQGENLLSTKLAAGFIGEMIATKHGAWLLFSAGYVPVIFDIMRLYPGLMPIQTLGCAAVKSLARWDETWEAVLTVEAATLVAAATKACSEECDFANSSIWGTRCLEAIASFLRYGEHRAKTLLFMTIIGTEGAVKASIKVIQGVAEAGKPASKDSCFILGNIIACCDNEIKLELAREGGVSFLLELMRSNSRNLDFQLCGCEALGQLTTMKHPAILESIAKADGVNILMDAIEQFPNNKDIFNYGGSAALLTREFELGRIQ